MKRRANTIAICPGLFALLLLLCAAGSASAQVFDIGSGGQPTITGALGGSVTGTSNVTQSLAVTVNFGEVSPLNANNIVNVVVPISIRSDSPYQVSVSVAGAFNANPQAVQRSDIGFGANNIRQMGANSRVCTRSQHLFRAPFNNDPAANISLNASGRTTYPSTLANVGVNTVILSGPRLSQGNVNNNQATNGYIFDAILAIRPQFYASGTFSATITFNISDGPSAQC